MPPPPDPAPRLREMAAGDIHRVVDYFLDADVEFLGGMGVDPDKLPARPDWIALIAEDLARSLPERDFYYLIWEVDGEAVGHCNISRIEFGREAYMHLHFWTADHRGKGVGTKLVAESVRRFCDLFALVDLFCEPYARNAAPNRTLAKVGFELVESYETVPGWLSYHQTVNRWRFDCRRARR